MQDKTSPLGDQLWVKNFTFAIFVFHLSVLCWLSKQCTFHGAWRESLERKGKEPLRSLMWGQILGLSGQAFIMWWVVQSLWPGIFSHSPDVNCVDLSVDQHLNFSKCDRWRKKSLLLHFECKFVVFHTHLACAYHQISVRVENSLNLNPVWGKKKKRTVGPP